jgi:hypothetical protein
MKKIITTVSFILLINTLSFSQNNIQWSKLINDSSKSLTYYNHFKPVNITNDLDGNTYVVYQIEYWSQSPSKDTTLNHLIKLSPEGDILWKRTIMPFSNNIYFNCFNRSNSKLYVLDNYLYFITSALTDTAKTSLILSKYDLNGNIIHQVTKTKLFWHSLNDIKVENNGNIFVAFDGIENPKEYISIYGFDTSFNQFFTKEFLCDSAIIDRSKNTASSSPIIEISDTTLNLFFKIYCDSTPNLSNSMYFKQYLIQFSLNTSDTIWHLEKTTSLIDYKNDLKFFDNKLFLTGNVIDIYNLTGTFLQTKPLEIITKSTFSPQGNIYEISNLNGIDNYYITHKDTSGQIFSNITPPLSYLYTHANNFKLKNNFLYLCGEGANIDPATYNGTIGYHPILYTNLFSKIDLATQHITTSSLEIPLSNGQLNTNLFNVDNNGNIYAIGELKTNPIDTSIYSSPYSTSLLVYKICYDCEHNIAGKVYSDTNLNCLQDSTEYRVENNLIHLMPEDVYTFTDTNGKYSFPKSNGNAIIEIIPLSTNFNVCPINYSLFSITSLNDTLNFGYQSITNIVDSKSNIFSNAARPGFSQLIISSAVNLSSSPINQSLFYVKLDPLVQFSNSIPFPDSIVGNQLFWNINSLKIGEKKNFQIQVSIPTNILLGTQIVHRSENIVANDQFPINNIDSAITIVTGSFDPNDKTAQPIGNGAEHYIDKNTRIKYTIQFQNTGTDTAFNVKIFDNLDSNIDISSLEILGSSHTFNYSLSNRKLKLYFDNILLPDSNINLSASQGFVCYSVLPKQNIDGKTIFNTADIYFDYNTPITTNTTFHTIGTVKEPIQLSANNISLYPNPNSQSDLNIYINIATTNEYKLEITDILGRNIKHVEMNKLLQGSYLIKVNVNSLQNGLYFVSLLSKENSKTISKKLIINK